MIVILSFCVFANTYQSKTYNTAKEVTDYITLESGTYNIKLTSGDNRFLKFNVDGVFYAEPRISFKVDTKVEYEISIPDNFNGTKMVLTYDINGNPFVVTINKLSQHQTGFWGGVVNFWNSPIWSSTKISCLEKETNGYICKNFDVKVTTILSLGNLILAILFILGFMIFIIWKLGGIK